MSKITTIKNIFYPIFTSFLIILFISCASTDKTETQKQSDADNKIEKKEEKTSQSANDKNVSEAVYNKTFSDIQDFIAKSNKIISDSNFEGWKKYLTKEYIDYYSNTENLKQISETPTLKKYKIVLRSLKDYFTYVVAPSRSEARLDSISFVDDSHVKAYMIIDGEPIILYNLVKIDNNWKIEK